MQYTLKKALNKRVKKQTLSKDIMQPKRVLLVDDDEMFIQVTGHRLKASGFQVSHASTADDGLSTMRSELPDVVITDARLGSSSGIDLCAQAHTDEKIKHIPIILLSGDDNVQDEMAAGKLNASYFLFKPYQSQELLKTINLALNPTK